MTRPGAAWWRGRGSPAARRRAIRWAGPPAPRVPGVLAPAGPAAVVAAMLLFALSLVGCSAGTASPTIAAPTTAPSVGATPADEQPGIPTDSLGGPPTALLSSGAADPRPGTLGGFAYGVRGAAAPWIPAEALVAHPTASGEPLAIGLDADGIAAWSVRGAGASDPSGRSAEVLGHDDRPSPDGRIHVVAPGAGRWVLEARIEYASGRGDGAYYWLLEVTPP